MTTQPINPQTVVNLILDDLRITQIELNSNARSELVVLARSCIAYTLRHYTQTSYPEVAKLMGRTSHAGSYEAGARLVEGKCDEQVQRLFPVKTAREYCDNVYDRAVSAIIDEIRAKRIGGAA